MVRWTRVFWLPILLTASPASATLLTGQFVAAAQEQTGISSDGTRFVIRGDDYPVPASLLPTSAYTFRLSPSSRFVISTRVASPSGCTGTSTRILVHALPAVPGDPLVEIRDNLCIPNGVAFSVYYDRPLSSPQAIAVFGGTSGAGEVQPVLWVDLVTGASAQTNHSRSIESISLRFAPSGNAAFVKHGLASPAGDVDWTMVDLCPGSLGALHAFWEVITAQAEASILEPTPGNYFARVSDPEFPSGATQFPIVDCLAPPPPPPPGTRVLRVEVEGEGNVWVRSTPSGIDCHADCDESYTADTEVLLQAMWSGGYRFERWRGDCSGTQPDYSILVDGEKECTAEFERIQANVRLTLTPPPSPVLAGAAIVYTATVENLGPDDTETLFLTLPFPPDLVPDGDTTSHACPEITPGVRRCILSPLEAGEQHVVSLGFDSLPSARQPVSSTAFVSNNVHDPVAADNSSTSGFTFSAQTDLAVVKSDLGDPVPAGRALGYQFTVTNTGFSSAVGIEVEDPLPAGFDPIGVPDGTLLCEVGALDPGERTRFTLLGRVGAEVAPGATITNDASVTGLDHDVDLSNNGDSCSTSILAPVPDFPLEIVRIADESVLVPGTSVGFGELGVPVVGPELVAFGGTGGGITGAYYWLDGGIFPIADSTLDLVDTSGECEFRANSHSPQLSLDGTELVFMATVEPEFSCRGRSGIFHVTPCGTRTVLDGRSHQAGAGGGFSEPSFSAGHVTYWAGGTGNIEVAAVDRSSLRTVASGDTAIPGGSGTFHTRGMTPQLRGGRVVFWAGSDVVNGHHTQQGLYIEATGGLARVVDRNTALPGQTQPLQSIGTIFAYDGSQVAFLASSEPSLGYGGVFRIDLSSSALTRIADTSMTVPGTGEPFFGFGSVAANSGRVLFSGWGFSTGPGLFLWSGGQLRTIIAPGEMLDGHDVAAFRFGPEALWGQRLAFEAALVYPTRVADAIYLVNLMLDPLLADDFESGDLSGWSVTQP